MDSDELKTRLKDAALRIIRLVDFLPNKVSAQAIARQIIRSGTSPAANYRAACLAKSDKDFINKLKMVEEELDETIFWLGLIMDAKIVAPERVLPLHDEFQELLKIIVSSIITTRKRIDSKDLPQ